MKKENAFLQKLDKIGNLTQVVCLSLFLTGVSVQGVSAETGFPISIIRKSKFPQNPKRSVRFSGKRTKRSVQKRKARNTQKAETKVL